MGKDIQYIGYIRVFSNIDCFYSESLSYDELFYIGGKISTREFFPETIFDLSNVKFNFGNMGRFYFLNHTICEARGQDIIRKLEAKHGKGSYQHLENFNLSIVPWEKIWEVVNSKRKELPQLANQIYFSNGFQGEKIWEVVNSKLKEDLLLAN